MIKLWTSIILVLLTSMVFGQSSETNMIFPKARIGITPSALLNYQPGIQVSIDKRIKEKVNFALEAGYIFTSANQAQGFRFRLGIETFLVSSKWVALTVGAHVNHRFTANYVDAQNIARNGEFEYVSHNARTDQILLGLNISENLMFKLSKRVYLELGTGLGLTRNELIPRGSDPNNTVDSFLRNSVIFVTESSSPYFYTHLNLSYDLGR